MADNERFCLFPIQDPELWEFYKTAKASYWTSDEIDFETDAVEWTTKLTEGERTFVKTILAFFSVADNIVNENLGTRFFYEVDYPEARQAYALQMAIEAIHAETYSLSIDRLIPDAAERAQLHKAALPCVQDKAAWAVRYLDSAAPLNERLMAFACVEGIFFSASVCALCYLKKRGLMPGLTFANELISRDEGQHVQLACAVLRRVGKPASAKIEEIVRSAIECEERFVDDALRCDLIGMNARQMKQYVRYVADYTLAELLDEPKLYGDANPFEFMNLISQQGKTNFFERRVGDYQRAGAMQTGATAHVLDEVDDF